MSEMSGAVQRELAAALSSGWVVVYFRHVAEDAQDMRAPQVMSRSSGLMPNQPGTFTVLHTCAVARVPALPVHCTCMYYPVFVDLLNPPTASTIGHQLSIGIHLYLLHVFFLPNSQQ